MWICDINTGERSITFLERCTREHCWSTCIVDLKHISFSVYIMLEISLYLGVLSAILRPEQVIHSFIHSSRVHSHRGHQSHSWGCEERKSCLFSVSVRFSVMLSGKYTCTHTNKRTLRLFWTDASKNSMFPRAPQIEPRARFPRAQKYR